jgi:outer membrane protein assembly factor BamA
VSWAAFLDAGIVGGSRLQNLQDFRQIVRGSAAITPGVGFRYRSPVGPIRIDLGYNPRQTEELTVVTTARDSTGREQLVPLDVKRRYTNGGQARGFWALFNQMVLHLSIGQAY